MRILVTGSRDWEDWRKISQEVISALLEVYGSYRVLAEAARIGDVTLIQGCAAGADFLAAQLARKCGWNVESYPAEWDRYGKRAGILRNIQMVDTGADICLAFIKNNSKGATHCAGYAEAMGIPVRRFRS